MQPDYSRQMLLKEIGERGQAALARGRVLVVGAGGLGSPALQYLAGAGVGCLGIVDADTLDASNLHRQPIFALEDAGRQKAALAAAAVQRINPAVRVELHALRLDADNALALIRGYDVVVDCSDNFRTKYLINDAAVLAHRPAVFASVYQYEGQLQVYKPEPRHACLRFETAFYHGAWVLNGPGGRISVEPSGTVDAMQKAIDYARKLGAKPRRIGAVPRSRRAFAAIPVAFRCGAIEATLRRTITRRSIWPFRPMPGFPMFRTWRPLTPGGRAHSLGPEGIAIAGAAA